MIKLIAALYLVCSVNPTSEHNFVVSENYPKVLAAVVANQDRLQKAAGIDLISKEKPQFQWRDGKIEVKNNKKVRVNPGKIELEVLEKSQIGLKDIQIDVVCDKPPSKIKEYKSQFIIKSNLNNTEIYCKVWITIPRQSKNLVRIFTYSSLVRFEKELNRILNEQQ